MEIVMSNNQPSPLETGDQFKISMSDRVFERLSQFIQVEYGIKMPRTKKTMLEGRLRKRLTSAGLTSYDHYCDYLFSDLGVKQELVHMIDAVTTNKTEFFREPVHFDYLVQTVLPTLCQTNGAGSSRKLNIWSAGCSTGEEPYTLAMVLSDYAEKTPGFDFSVLATDISVRVLETARQGIYNEAVVAGLPLILKQQYFLKSKNRGRQQVRVSPALRQRVRFGWLNLMEKFKLDNPVDVIFCRNVFIYFDRPTQKKIMGQFLQNLTPGGYIVLGLTEMLGDLRPALTRVASTIYKSQAVNH
jgi:chemotaxis protein methyltransferase CheR